MAEFDYKPNSQKYRDEQKTKTERPKLESVASGTARPKKNELGKVAGALISENASNVKSHIVFDVLVPAVKKLVSDIVKDGIEILLYGDTGRGNRGSGTSTVSYRNYYDRRDDNRGSGSSSIVRDRFDFDEITYKTRGEAELVLDQMDAALERFGIVSVADLYDLSNLKIPYTGNKYGWTNLRTAQVVRIRDGYTIKLPKALPID